MTLHDARQDPVLAVIERGNQRGGRDLSVVDLVEAGTLSESQAAWLMGRVRQGSSWLVGARPGGAGKTTVMSALLGIMPPPAAIRLATSGTGWEASRPGECVVAYEIGSGPFEAYVWGAGVRDLARLGAAGVRLVANLHADTLEEALDQICRSNGVPADRACAFGLFLPIRLDRHAVRGTRRRVEAIHAATAAGTWQVITPAQAEAEAPPDCADFLRDCLRAKRRDIGEVRRHWLLRLAETTP